MHSLPLFHRIAGRPVIVAGEGEAAAAKRRLVERAGGRVVGPDDGEARLAFVALDAPEALAARLKTRGVLVNVVDRPELCDFTTPSLLDRDPLLIAVGTGGVSAGLAKAVRLRLERLLPATLGALASALAEARAAIRARWPQADERRRALDAAMAEGGVLDPFVGDAEAVARWLEEDRCTAATRDEFTLIDDDPDSLTLHQARRLGQADLVAHEPGIPSAVLDRARADAVRIGIAPSAQPPAHAGNVVIIRRRG